MKINIFASSRYFMFNLSENFSHNATVFQKSKMPTQYLPSPSPPTGLCMGWERSGSFQPQAVALVMAMKQ
jgi:hypothetical protein